MQHVGDIHPSAQSITRVSVCPGRYLAKDNAFMTFASVLHVFDVVPALDSNGKQLDPTIQMTTGILSYVHRRENYADAHSRMQWTSCAMTDIPTS